MTSISVLLVEDHTLVREGLRLLLGLERDIAIVAEASNGREAVRLGVLHRPDVVLLDVALPDLNGLEALRQLRGEVPSTRCLFLSAHADDGYVDRALELGALGYIIKQCSSSELAVAIREVAVGRTYLSESIHKRLRTRESTRGGSTTSATGIRRLSKREAEILQLVAQGSPNKLIAAELGISLKTVQKHRQNLMDKLAIHDTAGLTRYAIAHGIIELSTQSTLEPV